MQRITRTLPVLAAVVLIGLAVWLAIEGARKEPGSVAAALGAVAIVVYQRRWEKRQEIDRLHRDKMAPIYEELIDTLKDMERLNDPEKQKEVLNFLNKDLTTKLLLYGPTSLIKEWGTWRTNAAGVTDPPTPGYYWATRGFSLQFELTSDTIIVNSLRSTCCASTSTS